MSLPPRLVVLLTLFLGACAAYDGRGLPGEHATRAEVEARMGPPALAWTNPDGSQQLAYPRGPAGVHTFMAEIGPDGRLKSLRNVLDSSHFARIVPGLSQDEVLHLIGPPVPGWTVTFPRRDELVWEWRYCDDWNEPARFNVLFAASNGRVRSTLSLSERQSLPFGMGDRRSWCSH